MTPLQWIIFGAACALVLALFCIGIIKKRQAPAPRFEGNVYPIRPVVHDINKKPPPGTVNQ